MNTSLVFSAEVRRAEGSTARLNRGVRSGELERVRRGAVIGLADWKQLDVEGRHRMTALAFLRAARGRVVFCGETAAVLLGIPVMGPLPDRPVVAVTPRTTCTDAGAIRRAIALDDAEIVRVGGVSVTSPLRTAMDLGAARGPDAAVVALSDVVRRWGVTLGDIEDHLLRRRPFRGVRSIDAVLPAVSGSSEAPSEALGMLRFLQLGFELPEQQVHVVVRRKNYWTDYGWLGARVLGETDGRLKYRSPADLWREKLREDDLREVSDGFLRLVWSDLFAPNTFCDKARRAGVPVAETGRLRRDRPIERPVSAQTA